MNALIVCLGFLFFAASVVANENFPNNEREAVSKEVSAMLESFKQGDAKALLEKTHPSIYSMVNGKEKFEAGMITAAKKLMEQGIVYESFEVGLPQKLYMAGKESICFVPKTSVTKLGDRRMKSTSYMVAIKGSDGTWRYLDGAGARRDPKILWTLLPDLPKEVELPENTVTVIKDEKEEKGGTKQPTTQSESKSEEADKPQPEAEGRSR